MANSDQPHHVNDDPVTPRRLTSKRHQQRLVSVDWVLALLSEHATELREQARLGQSTQPVTLSVSDALGRVLASDVRAQRSAPPCNVSSMDGYALVAADDTWPKRVVGESTPGAELATTGIGMGEALRIFTGAPLVAGADTVVPQEWCTTDNELVELASTDARAQRPIDSGLFVRRAGSDVVVGETVAQTGQRITPAMIGTLCAAGVVRVQVARQLRIGVLATGNELVDAQQWDHAGDTVSSSAVLDSARPTLLALIASAGYEPVDLGHVRDQPEAIKSAIKESLERVDVLVSIGGVSVGDHDHMPSVLSEIVDEATTPGGSFGRFAIDMQPGRPFAAAHVDGVLIAACPGNPVSVLVHWHVLLAPTIRVLAGAEAPESTVVFGSLGAPLVGDPNDTRTRYLRASVDGAGVVSVFGGQQSHQLHETSCATHLVVVAPGVSFGVGDLVPLIPLG